MKNNNIEYSIIEFFVTFFNIGNIKIAPGTFGSLATIPLFILINTLIMEADIVTKSYIATIYIADIIILYILSYFAIKYYITINKKDDPREVVIDEVIGQLIAYMIPFLFLPQNPTYINTMHWFLLILPFPLFRFFDITKPNLIGYFDKNIHSANGIILDDVVAGIYAGIIVTIIINFL
jgi:phosphatidylglycerophosphatase A